MIPQELHHLLIEQYGDALTATIEEGYAAERPVSFRYNPIKGKGNLAARLMERGIGMRRVEWYADAYLVEGAREDALRETELYQGGEIYLQSLSSMLPPLYLSPAAGETVLDMTAAPGGKTTEMYALAEGRALITACERDGVRFERMQYNLARQGAGRVTALKCDALALDDAFSFDKILLDAPCTGSGTLSPNRPARFSENYLARCTALQERLLKKALRLLKKGGEMVYSTCSVLRQENEAILEKCLGRGCSLQPIEPFAGLPLLPSGAGTLCVCPSREYEGFFLAKIKKEG